MPNYYGIKSMSRKLMPLYKNTLKIIRTTKTKVYFGIVKSVKLGEWQISYATNKSKERCKVKELNYRLQELEKDLTGKTFDEYKSIQKDLEDIFIE